MTLFQRTVLIIVSTFSALLFILAATSDVILLKSFTSLERTVLAGNVQKVRSEIDETYDELDSSSKDLVVLVEKSGASSISGLHIQSFVNRHIDVLVCFSSSGQVLSSQTVDFHNHREAHLSDDDLTRLGRVPPLAEHSSDGRVNGLLLLGEKPLQLVLRSVAGADVMILVGRYLDANEIRRISALTAFPVELVPLARDSEEPDIVAALASFKRGVANPSQVTDNGRIVGYSLFKDLFGQPVLIARIIEQRLLYEQGKAAITYVILSLFLAGGVFCGVMLFFIRGAILNRIEFLSATVKKISLQRDISSRLPVSGERDELAGLAGSINAMLDSLESAENAMRDSEERYRILFERAPDSIFIVGIEGDEAGKIISANRTAAEQHGYSVEELCNLSIFDLNTEESNKLSSAMIKRIYNGEWVTLEMWRSKKDASQFPVETHAGMVRIQGRNYILGFDRDITSRKLAEESGRMYLDRIRQLNVELNRQTTELAAANNELEAFNYSVSHDMRGPLTRISGYCQLLLEDDVVLDPQIKTYITRIHESGAWLNDMIEAMLHLAQVTSAEFVTDRVNLSHIAEIVVRELTLAEPDRNVQVVIAPDVFVAGDSRLLKILMTNLLNNAWKYTSRTDNACIEFGVSRTESAPIYFVRDNGAGFDMKDASRLFRVFTRLHDPAQFSGTGIGLATVQRIITRHSGRIWVEGEIGRGATFFFTLQPV